jgi:CRISPR-associated protein Csm2
LEQFSNSHRHSRDRESPVLNVLPIKFAERKPDLFDEVANQTDLTIADSGNKNKSTQLRKYYDELCMWH